MHDTKPTNESSGQTLASDFYMADLSVEPVEKVKVEGQMPVSIAKALIKIQKTLKPMKKTATNDAFKGATYVPLEDVMKLAHELLSAEGIGLTQSPITDENGHAALETTLFTGSGQSYTRITKLAMNKVDPQAHGSAITYTRRYSAMAILGLTGVGEDDDGNTATGVHAPITEEQKGELDSLMIHLKYSPKDRATKIFDIKTRDHAIVALENFRKLVAQRARDDESKANALKIEVGTHEDAPDLGEPADPTSLQGFKQRLKALRLASPSYENKVINIAASVPFLEKVMDKPERITGLDTFLKALESGVQRLEAEFYAPTSEPIVVDENVA